jgi:hypothetical protein
MFLIYISCVLVKTNENFFKCLLNIWIVPLENVYSGSFSIIHFFVLNHMNSLYILDISPLWDKAL